MKKGVPAEGIENVARRDILASCAALTLTSGISIRSSMAQATEQERSFDSESLVRIANAVDTKRVIRWALELADIYSPTGDENSVAEYLMREYRALGLEAKMQPVAPDRCNAIARLQGKGGGYTLMFNCHLDTFQTNDSPDRFHFAKPDVQRADAIQKPIKARQVDGSWITGQEIGNMKCAMAAYLGAVDAVMRCGVDLTGDIILAGVVGANPTLRWTDSGASNPVDDTGIGTKFMLDHGVHADMCILGEPTSLGIALSPLGRVRLKITVTSGEQWQFDATSTVISALGSWRANYRKLHTFHELYPSFTIAAVQSQPESFGSAIYVEFRITPRQNALAAIDELRTVLSQLHDSRIKTIIEPLMIEPATEVRSDRPAVRALIRAHSEVRHSVPQSLYVNWSGDANRLNQRGIPTVIYGPGWNIGSKGYNGDTSDNAMNFQRIEDLENACRVYSILIADIGTRIRVDKEKQECL